jgi:hypothetical protein
MPGKCDELLTTTWVFGQRIYHSACGTVPNPEGSLSGFAVPISAVFVIFRYSTLAGIFATDIKGCAT